MEVKLYQGLWFAGVTRPSLITRDLFERGLRLALPIAVAPSVGAFRWYTRDQTPPVDPHKDPNYRDDWNEWFSVEFRGKDATVTVPNTLSWLQGMAGDPNTLRPDPKPPAPALPAPATPPAASSADTGSLVALLLLLYFATRSGRRWA
jgi:hypothetical protein